MIYNPWSLLNCFSDREISFYWNETGFPSIIVKALKKKHYDLEETFNAYCDKHDLKGFDLRDPNPIALLYQLGYLTIKGYERDIDLYLIGIPNEEMRVSLCNYLLPYCGVNFSSESRTIEDWKIESSN